nr:MAG TPA: hypothetical protein [Bacteriophage sp.]DAX06064.1 MAG TPA: hypothetical protein [Bacteriophage sp.]
MLSTSLKLIFIFAKHLKVAQCPISTALTSPLFISPFFSLSSIL